MPQKDGTLSPDQLKPRQGKRGNPKWFKGMVSPNPTGRTPKEALVTSLAREYTQSAIHTLASIMTNRFMKGSTRVRAAEVLLDRAWGRPKQTLVMDAGNADEHDAVRRAALEELRGFLGAASAAKSSGVQIEAKVDRSGTAKPIDP